MSCSILHYPLHTADVLHGADGTRIVIRPMLPQDAALQRGFFCGLSMESRRGRFMTPLKHVPEALIERLSAIDHLRHVALLAAVIEDGREVMIGEARYVVDTHDGGTCEMAIAVADAWQSRGIGRALLDRLLRQAATVGLHRMVAQTLAGNRRMINLARRAAFAVTTSPEDWSVALLEKLLLAERPAAA